MTLEARSLRKVYGGGKIALDGIDVTFGVGITGLIGPNGSGKTTLLRLLATTLAPTSGKILYKGVDAVRRPDVLRRALLYVPQNFVGYTQLGAQEFLEYLARLRGVAGGAARDAAHRALQIVGLEEDARQRLGAYTPGMLQRLAIAYLLATNAQVVLLDEPAAGLDPGARQILSDSIRHAAGERIMILCTHIHGDLDGLADRVIEMRAGRLAGVKPIA